MKHFKKEQIFEGEIVKTHWDIKKIGIGIIVLILLFIAVGYAIKFVDIRLGTGRDGGVLGASRDETDSKLPPLPNREDVEDIVSDARDVLSQITSENFTSSQAAIQKIISDLQSLQGKNAIGVICSLICKDK